MITVNLHPSVMRAQRRRRKPTLFARAVAWLIGAG